MTLTEVRNQFETAEYREELVVTKPFRTGYAIVYVLLGCLDDPALFSLHKYWDLGRVMSAEPGWVHNILVERKPLRDCLAKLTAEFKEVYPA
jgi:hypothetical protein